MSTCPENSALRGGDCYCYSGFEWHAGQGRCVPTHQTTNTNFITQASPFAGLSQIIGWIIGAYILSACPADQGAGSILAICCCPWAYVVYKVITRSTNSKWPQFCKGEGSMKIPWGWLVLIVVLCCSCCSGLMGLIAGAFGGSGGEYFTVGADEDLYRAHKKRKVVNNDGSTGSVRDSDETLSRFTVGGRKKGHPARFTVGGRKKGHPARFTVGGMSQTENDMGDPGISEPYDVIHSEMPIGTKACTSDWQCKDRGGACINKGPKDSRGRRKGYCSH